VVRTHAGPLFEEIPRACLAKSWFTAEARRPQRNCGVREDVKRYACSSIGLSAVPTPRRLLVQIRPGVLRPTRC
jgi:hypothetical protein